RFENCWRDTVPRIPFGYFDRYSALAVRRDEGQCPSSRPLSGRFPEKNMKTANIVAAVLLAGLAGSVQAAAPAQEGKTDKGEALVDSSGKALYTYDKDADGKSNCNDKCAQNWPPLAAKADAEAEGDWTIVKRDDGSSQWAYKGKPL